ncbi:MAG: HAD family hydrolase [Candidatus Bathyarchaeales archaeon]
MSKPYGYNFWRTEGCTMIKAVVFDLDGTLVKFNLDYKSLRAEARDFLIRQGVPASVLSINESIFSMLKKTEIFMKNNGKKEKDLEEVYKGIWSLTEKYELEAAKSTNLVPGATEVLKKLKEKSFKIGLCTVNSEKTSGYILKKFKIEGFFNAVTPRDHVKHVKPDVEHLEATLKALEVKPEEAIMVGDSPIDMECARKLGTIAVGVPTGVSKPQELMDAGAHYLITSITDLPTLIEQINKA